MTAARLERQLIVEGDDDKHVTIHLMRKLRPSWHHDATTWGGGFKVESAGNDDQALRDFAMAAKGSANYRIGLVIDADDEPGKRVADRWQKVRLALNELVSDIPGQLLSTGWIARTKLDLRVGVWVMPDNANEGALEAFITPFVPPADTSWPYAQTAIEEAKRNYKAPYPEHHSAKVRLHTWLAWRKEAGRPYGRAIDCGDLVPENNPVAEAFAQWFERLFIE